MMDKLTKSNEVPEGSRNSYKYIRQVDEERLMAYP